MGTDVRGWIRSRYMDTRMVAERVPMPLRARSDGVVSKTRAD